MCAIAMRGLDGLERAGAGRPPAVAHAQGFAQRGLTVVLEYAAEVLAVQEN